MAQTYFIATSGTFKRIRKSQFLLAFLDRTSFLFPFGCWIILEEFFISTFRIKIQKKLRRVTFMFI